MNNLKDHLLISVPHLRDNIFGKSVVYICEHNLDGAIGLIINKPIDKTSFQNITKITGMSRNHYEKITLYFGGPILAEKIIALHTNELEIKTAVPINKKISISSGKEIIRDIGKDINSNFKLFCGHSEWSPGQLEREIENGDWLLQTSKVDLLFKTPTEKLWEFATKSLGINVVDISNMSGSA